MKRILAALLLVQLVGVTPAFAQEDMPQKYYDMEGLELDGGKLVPDAELIEAMKKPKFQRLLQMKRSFMPEIRQSAEAPELK